MTSFFTHIIIFATGETMEEVREKITNRDLYKQQLETLKLFYERKLLTKEQYEYELQVLAAKMKLND